MLSEIKTGTLLGIDGQVVTVEVDIAQGLPNIIIVGLPNTIVKEAKDRVRSAINNSGMKFPMKRITINLSPAYLRKDGGHFDLPIAVAILISSGEIDTSDDIEKSAFIGELLLNGQLSQVEGVLPLIASLKEKGIKKFYIPMDNIEEAMLVKDVEIYGVSTLVQLIHHLQKNSIKPQKNIENDIKKNKISDYDVDFSDVKGQDSVKRAVMISCSGGHGIFMMGPPGAGKSMIAKRIPTVLPNLKYEECLELTKILSISGELRGSKGLISERPFRAPHPTISQVALVGGGNKLRPGEISKAHKGVLFLDEFPEFKKDVLETLRQPLEDKIVTLSRASGTVTYPCDTTLVVAANPCPCGFLGSEKHECTCTSRQITNYRSKISGPILDRIDIHINVIQPNFKDIEKLSNQNQTINSKDMLIIIEKTRKLQEERYKKEKFKLNSQIPDSKIKKYCVIDEEGRKLMKMAFEKLGLSMRGYNKIIKISRTIADIEDKNLIEPSHIAEAIGYRF